MNNIWAFYNFKAIEGRGRVRVRNMIRANIIVRVRVRIRVMVRIRVKVSARVWIGLTPLTLRSSRCTVPGGSMQL